MKMKDKLKIWDNMGNIGPLVGLPVFLFLFKVLEENMFDGRNYNCSMLICWFVLDVHNLYRFQFQVLTFGTSWLFL